MWRQLKFSLTTKMAAGLVLCIHLLTIVLSVGGQMAPKSNKFFAVAEDVPFIRCSVCGKALKHVQYQVKELRREATSRGKKVDEDDILNIVEGSCDPDKKSGEWISKYDIQESEDGLKITEQKSYGRCQRECKTIAKACEESIGDADTDIGELLWKNEMSLSKLINKVCYDMTGACTKRLPKFKKGQRKDEIFKEMSNDEKKAYDVMKTMKSASGMPGMEMYSKEDIAQMKNEFEESPKSQKVEEEASHQMPTSDETKLGFTETVKAIFSSLYGKVKNLLTFGGRESEL